MAKIKHVAVLDGSFQTYDLEVDHPNHQFYLANGILTSNSHAVSYAFDSYFCAYLFHKYPQEWLCAWLESAEGNPKEKSKAISSVKSFGYEVVKLDINKSQRNWTIVEGNKIMPSFKSVKGIGDSAINEILQNRPYNNLRDFLWDEFGNWRHSKLNKRCFDVLTKLEAFDSMGIVGEDKFIKNYKQLNFLLVDMMQEVKKGGEAIFMGVADSIEEMPDWTQVEKMDFLKELAGIISVDHVVDQDTQDKLSKTGVKSITDFLELAADGEPGLVWFVLESSIPKFTKNGKEYMLFNVLDQTGSSQRMYVWGAKHNRSYETNRLYVCEIKKSDFVSTVAWKLKKVDV